MTIVCRGLGMRLSCANIAKSTWLGMCEEKVAVLSRQSGTVRMSLVLTTSDRSSYPNVFHLSIVVSVLYVHLMFQAHTAPKN